MPLYEYVCQSCRQESELLVRSSDERPACPHCGSVQLEKQLSLPVAHGPASAERLPPGGGPCGGHCACFPEG